jgi:hypothetical protein
LEAGVLWLIVALMQDFDYQGDIKVIPLLLIGGAAPALPWLMQGIGHGRRMPRPLSLAIVAAPAMTLAILTAFTKSRTQIEFCIIIFISSIPLILYHIKRKIFDNINVIWITLPILLICATIYVMQFLIYIDAGHTSDIALATLRAIDVMRDGQNPYAVPIDLHAEYASFAGYKYPPLMIMIYAPLSLMLGLRGLQLTNLILCVLVAACVFALARRGGGLTAGLIALGIFLGLPGIPPDIYAHAVTDPAPVLPLVAAFLVMRARPGLAGLLIGLSIATKLFPGVLVAICCLRRPGILRYAAGGLAGFLIPVAGFVAWDPMAFLRNIVLFIFLRPPDVTSWMYGLPSVIPLMARLLFLASLVAATSYNLWKNPTELQRCALVVMCIIGALVTGPDAHNNYIIWWAPFICVLIACQSSALLASVFKTPQGAAGFAEPAGLKGTLCTRTDNLA